MSSFLFLLYAMVFETMKIVALERKNNLEFFFGDSSDKIVGSSLNQIWIISACSPQQHLENTDPQTNKERSKKHKTIKASNGFSAMAYALNVEPLCRKQTRHLQ